MYAQFDDFDDHALVCSRHDRASGLSAFIVVHNDNCGPAIGGCRMLDYPDVDAAITDVLRLSRGMTYKTAIAGIPYGGGKAVIIADPRTAKTQALLHAMGDFVESLGGRYITSFDSGTNVEDIRIIGERARFVGGTHRQADNASTRTAAGVFYCLRAAVEIACGTTDLKGVRIAIQGVGNVGSRLAEKAAAEGATVIVADRDVELAARVAAKLGARQVGVDKILGVDCDVFSPCALGACLGEHTVTQLKAKAVVGGANNQLVSTVDDARLRDAGILYCPDYLANAGGIIDLHYQRTGWTAESVDRHVRSLADTFRQVVERSRNSGMGTAAIADQMAEERFRTRGQA